MSSFRIDGGSLTTQAGRRYLFLVMACVHQWGWSITLNPDGTATMRSPDGSRVYHSHSPPTTA
jgi:hypothetical protein